ncbi:hypothetical protein KKC1_22410 [Calderihabitans maritimus]|uniref:Uncharacterized protein n=1 Tax=Calderihabitans maritimus TaxID=1246530 RepID=A0A1Z5HUY1_9FIRM|nr:hypothetical protein KKC1_22410 [Calderihabitans maritimus]
MTKTTFSKLCHAPRPASTTSRKTITERKSSGVSSGKIKKNAGLQDYQQFCNDNDKVVTAALK